MLVTVGSISETSECLGRQVLHLRSEFPNHYPEEHFWVLELFDGAAVCCCNDSVSQLNLTIDFTELFIVRFLKERPAKQQIEGKH